MRGSLSHMQNSQTKPVYCFVLKWYEMVDVQCNFWGGQVMFNKPSWVKFETTKSPSSQHMSFSHRDP